MRRGARQGGYAATLLIGCHFHRALELIDEQLTAGNDEQDARAQIYDSQVSKTEVSLWLEMTRWPRYFHGLKRRHQGVVAGKH
jgi:hypothetical protein